MMPVHHNLSHGQLAEIIDQCLAAGLDYQIEYEHFSGGYRYGISYGDSHEADAEANTRTADQPAVPLTATEVSESVQENRWIACPGRMFFDTPIFNNQRFVAIDPIADLDQARRDSFAMVYGASGPVIARRLIMTDGENEDMAEKRFTHRGFLVALKGKMKGMRKKVLLRETKQFFIMVTGHRFWKEESAPWPRASHAGYCTDGKNLFKLDFDSIAKLPKAIRK